jgi:hypothetical protein
MWQLLRFFAVSSNEGKHSVVYVESKQLLANQGSTVVSSHYSECRHRELGARLKTQDVLGKDANEAMPRKLDHLALTLEAAWNGFHIIFNNFAIAHLLTGTASFLKAISSTSFRLHFNPGGGEILCILR